MSNTNDILKKVRMFFKRIGWKNVLTFSFFVVVAAILWFMQIYRQQFEISVSIPVKYINTPDDAIFYSELPDHMNVRVRDDGANLLKYSFKKKDSLIIDVSKKIELHDSGILQGKALEEKIRTRLYTSSEIVNYQPILINFLYETIYKKKLSIEYSGHIDCAPGYIIDGEISLSPDSVLAYGASSILENLRHVLTTSDTICDITVEDSVITTFVQPIQDVKFIPSTVELYIPIDKIREKEVEVTIECINLPKDLNIKFFPSSIKIPFLVGLKKYDEVDAADFKIIVDYNIISKLENRSIPVAITRYPKYIQTRSPIPSEVEFVLEQN